jgi:hypothetical protein
MTMTIKKIDPLKTVVIKPNDHYQRVYKRVKMEDPYARKIQKVEGILYAESHDAYFLVLCSVFAEDGVIERHTELEAKKSIWTVDK